MIVNKQQGPTGSNKLGPARFNHTSAADDEVSTVSALTIKPKLMMLNVSYKHQHNAMALLDTGANLNFISIECVKESKLQMTRVQNPFACGFSNGQLDIITSVVSKLRIKLDGLDGATWQGVEDFYVLPKCENLKMALSMDFLRRNRGVIIAGDGLLSIPNSDGVPVMVREVSDHSNISSNSIYFNATCVETIETCFVKQFERYAKSRCESYAVMFHNTNLDAPKQKKATPKDGWQGPKGAKVGSDDPRLKKPIGRVFGCVVGTASRRVATPTGSRSQDRYNTWLRANC